MKIIQQVTSLLLSKKLKELGVSQVTLFSWQISSDGIPVINISFMGEINCEDFSAFTSAELGFLMPYSYMKNGKLHFIETTAGHTDHDYCTVCSSHFYETERDSNAIVGDDFDGEGNEADARAMMLIYLIENNLIEVKK